MLFRIAVLGATGYIGSPYRREIRECPEEAIIVSLCGRRRDLLQAATKEHNAELITDDWQEAIAHPGINLVLVCTPDALHHSAVMACAQRNLHVVCEKPLGLNATEAMQMWNACPRFSGSCPNRSNAIATCEIGVLAPSRPVRHD